MEMDRPPACKYGTGNREFIWSGLTHVSREAKLSLLSCVSATSDPRLQELGLQLHLGNVALQINDNEYSILANARKQLSVLPSARSLYLKAKTQLTQYNKSQCENHLQTLTVQSKFGCSVELESSCKTWNRLLAGFHPSQLSFLLRAASDTLPTAINLRRWSVQCVYYVIPPDPQQLIS